MTKAQNGVNPSNIVLLCDEEEDRRLFLMIRASHPLLVLIPNENVRTYDQARSSQGRSPLGIAVAPLHQDDRPDWIFCHENRPVLVTELTKHAYTGDNGLQRFARFAAAAENGVPFIYFGPLKRVRDDELDGLRTPSPRRLTSYLFEGMQRLSDVHRVPQIYVEWRTDEAGLPASLPFRPTDDDVQSLYGRLLDRIAALLFQAPLCIVGTPLSNPVIAAAQNETRVLAQTSNTRDTDVRFQYSQEQLRELLLRPTILLEAMSASNYFTKGKPDKALAEYALTVAKANFVQHVDGRVEELTAERRSQFFDRLLRHPKFSVKSLIYYTGYKWRSDPHCGVLVNIDYRLCRAQGETTPKDRRTGLVVVYPRVSLRGSEGIGAELAGLSRFNPGGLKDIFESRYGSAAASEKMAACLNSNGLFGIWSNGTKQARLFRRYTDLVLLNDGLVLGDGLAGWST